MEPSTFAMFGTPKACQSPRLPPRRSYGSPCLATVMHRRLKIESYSHTIMFFHWSKCIHISNTFAHTYIYNTIICIYIYVFGYLLSCNYVFLKNKSFIYIYIHIYLCIYSSIHMYFYSHTSWTCVCMCIYIYIYM